jgi:hypothetical protein
MHFRNCNRWYTKLHVLCTVEYISLGAEERVGTTELLKGGQNHQHDVIPEEGGGLQQPGPAPASRSQTATET